MSATTKYTEGLDMNQFKVISEISHYNNNYHIGFGRELLFAKSDDDNTTEWWLIMGHESIYLGESYISDGDKLIRYTNQTS